MVALLIDGHTLVRRAESVQDIDVKVRACLNDSASDQATLGDAKKIDLLSCVVGIVMQLVAHDICLPLHPHELRGGPAVTNFDTFDDSLIVGCILDHVDPTSNATASTVNTVKEGDRGDGLVCFFHFSNFL